MSEHAIARADGVHVLAERCPTCIFRPGNPMHLQRGRVAEMVREAVAEDSCIVCHATLEGDEQAVCRGFWDAHRHRSWPLRLAEHLDAVVYDPPVRERPAL